MTKHTKTKLEKMTLKDIKKLAIFKQLGLYNLKKDVVINMILQAQIEKPKVEKPKVVKEEVDFKLVIAPVVVEIKQPEIKVESKPTLFKRLRSSLGKMMVHKL